MPQFQTINRQLAYIPETVFGTTPATPQTTLLEFVTFTPTHSAEDIRSQTLASHAQLVDRRNGNVQAAAELAFELNPTNADTFLEAGLMGTWTTNVLKVGKTARSFTLEEGQNDGPQYRTLTGATINTLGMSLTNDGYAQINCGVVGKALSAWTATSIDSTPTAAATGSRFFHDGGVYKIGGSVVASMQSVTWTWSNGLTPVFVLGSSAVAGFNIASVRELTGSASGLFESVTEANKFIANTDSSIQYQLIAGSDSLDVKIGSLNYTNVSYDYSQGGVVVNFDFVGKYNAADASSLVLTRV